MAPVPDDLDRCGEFRHRFRMASPPPSRPRPEARMDRRRLPAWLDSQHDTRRPRDHHRRRRGPEVPRHGSRRSPNPITRSHAGRPARLPPVQKPPAPRTRHHAAACPAWPSTLPRCGRVSARPIHRPVSSMPTSPSRSHFSTRASPATEKTWSNGAIGRATTSHANSASTPANR